MTFEESLYFELNKVTDLNGCIYPIHAIERISSPFMTYCKSGLTYDQVLFGQSRAVEGPYTMDILHTSYKDLQVLFKAIKEILLSFSGRRIGDNGPLVQSVSVGDISDLFENELSLFRINFTLTIRFEEV